MKLTSIIAIIFVLQTIIETVFANSNQEYYKKLDLPPQSEVLVVKKQCKILMAKLKPENNPGNYEAHQKYIDVKEICQILTLPDKKQIYDQYGDEGLKQLEQGGGQQQMGGGLHSLFGMGGGGGNQRQTGPNMAADIPVTLQDLYNGGTKSFSITRNVLCDHCKGTGDKDGKLKTCRHCKGKGHVMQNVSMGIGFNMQMQQTCDRCGGKGKTGSGNCPVCRGKKVKKETKDMEVEVKPGMKDKQTIVFRGEAEQSPEHRPGDLIFTLKMKPHGYFKRIEDTLYTTFDLKLKEAILGFDRNIRHLDDHYTNVNSKAGQVVQPFSYQIKKGEGMPKERNPSQKGDMVIQQNVVLPKKLTTEDREILKKIFDLGRK